MTIQEGFIPFKNAQTYFRIVEPTRKKTPLLFLHGGPGSTHNSFELLDELALLSDRPLIMYDQYGCGLSKPEKEDTSLYTKETWVEELINLREKLSLDKVHLLGHSWGGMLAIIYLCDYNPKGVLSVHLSSTLASASLWDKETHRLISYLPTCHQQAIEEAERKQDFSSLEFALANEAYLKMTVSNLQEASKPLPSCLTREKIRGEKAYLTAWGPSEFKPLGNLRDYEYLEKLSTLTLPVLLTSGTMDESTPLQNKAMYDHLTNAVIKEWTLLDKSRHLTYFEQKEDYLKTTNAFLTRVEEREEQR